MEASRILVAYASRGGCARSAAWRIAESLGADRCVVKDVATVSRGDLESARALVLGSSTTGCGDLPYAWGNALPRLLDAGIAGKPTAFFGVGNQRCFPGTFVDAMGTLHQAFSTRGIDLRGTGWPTDGYVFDASRALKEGAFVGLALDQKNQPEWTDDRIASWIATLGEF